MRVALVLLLLAVTRDPSCGGVDTPASGVNAPCTRDKDCQSGLVCAGGVCASPDAASPADAGSDVEDAADGHD